MVKLRVTKVICPSCEGTGKFLSLAVLCMWCRGEKRIPTERAHRYARNLHAIADEGFICGDHDYEHKIKMEERAGAIYALTGRDPPWSRQTPSAGLVDRLGEVAEKSRKAGDAAVAQFGRDFTLGSEGRNDG